jgi:hypothetical protein
MRSRLLSALVVAMLLMACAHQPVLDLPTETARAKAAKLPVLVYEKSLAPFKITFVNTSGKLLVSLDLTLAFHAADGRPAQFKGKRVGMAVRLNGAFARDKSYTPYPSSGYILDGDENVQNLDFSAGPGGAMPDLSYDTDQGKATPGCFTIEKIDVHYANGTLASIQEHINDAVSPSIGNRC